MLSLSIILVERERERGGGHTFFFVTTFLRRHLIRPEKKRFLRFTEEEEEERGEGLGLGFTKKKEERRNGERDWDILLFSIPARMDLPCLQFSIVRNYS